MGFFVGIVGLPMKFPMNTGEYNFPKKPDSNRKTAPKIPNSAKATEINQSWKNLKFLISVHKRKTCNFPANNFPTEIESSKIETENRKSAKYIINKLYSPFLFFSAKLLHCKLKMLESLTF